MVIYSILVVLALALTGAYYVISQPANVDGITCDTLEHTVMHVHSNLSVIIDNRALTVPAAIGINDNTCLYWLHTHDISGLIHVESPVFANYTLGQFIDIWKKTQQNSETLALLDNSTVTAYVNNVLYACDYRNVVLRDHESIRLVGISLGQIKG